MSIYKRLTIFDMFIVFIGLLICLCLLFFVEFLFILCASPITVIIVHPVFDASIHVMTDRSQRNHVQWMDLIDKCRHIDFQLSQ